MKVKPTTKIWLKFFGIKFRIPVNPKDIEVKRSANPDEYDIVGKGQIAIPQYPNLRTFKFKSFFPGDYDVPYAVNSQLDLKGCCDLLNKAMSEAKVGKFVIHRPSGYNVSTKVIVRSFTTTDTGGEPLDLSYSLELEEYIPYKAEKVVIKNKKDKKTKKKTKKKAVTKKQRPTESTKIRVGAKVAVNGKYWYTSAGANPSGDAKNLKTEIKRIVKGAKYPYLVGTYGWTSKENIRVT